MSKTFKYDYYLISIPTEAYENDKDLIHGAIDEARERAKLYCMPANWYGRIIRRGGHETMVRVCRKRNNTTPKA